MARPFRHPKTGIYWYRKRVPDALRSLVGKREEKVTLKTRDPAEAKIAHAKVASEIEQRWRRLAAGAQSLSQKTAEAIAGEIYRSMVAEHEDNPSQVERGVSAFLVDKAVVTGSAKITLAGKSVESSKALLEKVLASRSAGNAKRIDRWLNSRGWILTLESRNLVDKAVETAILQARAQLYRMHKGDYRPDPDADRFPQLETPRKISKDKFALLRVFDDYAGERKLKPDTIKRWRPIMKNIASEVPDIRDLTRDWCIEWKDRQVARGISLKSVREVYVASLKSMCEWAVDNNRLKENPASRIKVKVPKDAAQAAKRGYTDAEAAKVLRASLEPMSKRLSQKHRAARRWIPTLCAYTGARVGEMAQLRKHDVRKVDGIWMLRITPEAGTVKTDQEREIAIHPEIIRQGFIEFVSQSSERLFYDSDSPRGGSNQNPTSRKVGQRIAEWIRDDLGITDKRVSPNHAWRHRFRTVAEDVDMKEVTLEYIQGHAPASVGRKYGERKPRAQYREISKIPVIDIGPKAHGRRGR